MRSETKKIREIAKHLLESNQVEVVIGYEKGTLPLRSSPGFIRKVEDVEKLIWDATCENNLARFLRGRKGKVAIVAKGCDTRAIVSLIKEKQLSRDQLYIIGVPCQGVLDRKKVARFLDGKELQSSTEGEDDLILMGDGFEKRVEKGEFIHDICKTCTYRTPVICDELVGEKLEVSEVRDDFATVTAFESKTPEERWAYFMQEMSKCIRCYACRNVCPVCYCPECVVDCSKPCWIGKTTHISDTALFHIVRTLHTAGRCVDCGACVRACPMDVDLRLLSKKMDKDIQELFGYQAGVSFEDVPPLVTFRLDDPQDFIW